RLALGVVTRGPFPGTSPCALNCQYMRITLGRCASHRGTQHRIRARWNDAPGSRCMVLDGTVNRSVVREDIRGEASADVIDVRQQFRHVRRVVRMAFRHCGGDNAALSMHPNVPFLPAPGLLLAVFLAMPCTLAADLSPCTVDDQVDR